MENNSLEVSTVDSSIAVYQGASMLVITEEEQNKLLASFDINEIEIRPDGLIYLPQVFWRKRLNQSFGIGQWCLIVKNSSKDPDTSKDKLYLQGILMARGHYVAEAVGEAELHSDNKNQSWASVWESAKSDCITRCCKDLGIASELWQPQFIANWIRINAIMLWRVDDKGRKTKNWRKKNAEPFWWEKDNKQATPPPPAPQEPVKPAVIKVPVEVQEAISKLANCATVDELSLFKETLDKKIVVSSDFKTAAMLRYNAILNATK